MGFHISYDIMDRHCIAHTKYGGVVFEKDEMGLPYINTKTPSTWTLYKPSGIILKVSSRNKLPRPNSLAKPKELLAVNMKETLN